MVAGRLQSEIIIVVSEGSDRPGERAATFDHRSGEWTPIESPPLSDRRYAAGVWADDQFVLWGGGGPGSDAGEADGAAYNPATGTWSPLPVGPGPGRRLHSMIYAGDRLYISATRTQSPPLQLRLAAADS